MKQICKIPHLQLFAEEEIPDSGAEERYSAWLRQAEEARAFYPGLDLAVEAENPAFAAMLRAGVDVGSAYLVTHQEQVIPALMHRAAQGAQAQMASRIAANNARPQENGIGTHAAAITRPDVSRMTRADRQEIRRRVAAGEKIQF